jgi:tryptophanyl-tRNA synthetase
MGVDVFLVMADYQALTDRNASDQLRSSVADILLDYLSIGIDPTRTTIFCHSMVGPLNQLMLPFLSVVTLAELQRNPTVKDEISTGGIRAVSGLMMTYPVHQAADILFCKGNLVPGGKDQLPHVEVTRLIARRINNLYFSGQQFFPEPELLLSEAPLLLGVDGRKMGKSLDNAIYLHMSEDETARLIKRAKTDADRLITYSPETRPEVSNLVLLTALCTGDSPQAIADRIGAQGAAELKRVATEAVNERFRTIRCLRKELSSDMDSVWKILRDGVDRANIIAADTLEKLRAAMGMNYFQR